MLFSTLWSYRMATKIVTSFMSFHLVHGIKWIIPTECEIPTLHTVLHLLPDTTPLEQCFLHLERLSKDHWASLQHNEAHKAHTKTYFNQ